MSKVKILIVEDELLVAMNITDFLEDLGYDVLEPQINYEGAVECLVNEKPDIALLDIQIEGEKNGIDLAHYIREHVHIPFIFLTSMADSRTVSQAKVLQPNAYLVKPFGQDNLYSSIELALYNFHSSFQAKEIEKEMPSVKIRNAFFIKSNSFFHKVKFSEIIYVKSDHVYMEIQTRDGKRHVMRSSMTALLADLTDNFIRIHRSHVINIDYIDSLNQNFVILKGHQIPIAKNHADQLMRMIGFK